VAIQEIVGIRVPLDRRVAFALLTTTTLAAAKCSGGRRKALKRLVPAKQSRDFNLDFVPPDLEFVPPGLDFLPKNLGFPSGKIWISFLPLAAAARQIRSSTSLAPHSHPGNEVMATDWRASL
jgi:hypothetical protein